MSPATAAYRRLVHAAPPFHTPSLMLKTEPAHTRCDICRHAKIRFYYAYAATAGRHRRCRRRFLHTYAPRRLHAAACRHARSLPSLYRHIRCSSPRHLFSRPPRASPPSIVIRRHTPPVAASAHASSAYTLFPAEAGVQVQWASGERDALRSENQDAPHFLRFFATLPSIFFAAASSDFSPFTLRFSLSFLRSTDITAGNTHDKCTFPSIECRD